MDSLREDQLDAFDREYVSDERFTPIQAFLKARYADDPFMFVDAGGGNGVFADRILALFPQAHCAVLDLSASLLAKNTPDPRKKIICGSIENLSELLRGTQPDVIFFNWVLHHLVHTGSYEKSSNEVIRALDTARRTVGPRGFVAVYENCYEGVLIASLSSRLIFAVTSSKTLAKLARVAGANTAGVGVLFRPKQGWLDMFRRARLQVEHLYEDHPWTMPVRWRIPLMIRRVNCAQFWLKG